MQPEPLQLTKELQLRADGRPEDAAPSWETSRLRMRLMWGPRFGVAFFLIVLVGSAFFLVAISRPYWPGHIDVPATVTSQHQYFSKLYRCDLGVRFTLGGESRSATYGLGTVCAGLPAPGTAVVVKVDPADASNLLIVGLDAYPRKLAFVSPILAAAFLAGAGWILWAGLSSYRRPRTLARTQPWRQLTATVMKSSPSNRSSSLTLQAADMAGQLQVFQLTYFGPGPWPAQPQGGDLTTVWILADGGRQVLLSRPDINDITLGRVRVSKAST